MTALGQMRQALAYGVTAGIVPGDAAKREAFARGYGDETAFRVGARGPGLSYVLGIRPGTTIWRPGQAPLPPAPGARRRGARAPKLRCLPALPPCGSARHIATERAPRPGRRSGCWPSGPKAGRNPQDTGCPACPRAPRPSAWCTRPRRVGASSATIRNSGKTSASDTMRAAPGRAAPGGAFTIMPACASQPTASWSPGAAFPPSAAFHPRADRDTSALPSLPAARHRPSGPNAMSRSPSPPSGAA